MKRCFRPLVALLLLSLAAACSSDDSLNCELDDFTTLASSDWPSERHDAENTGRLEMRDTTLQPGGEPSLRCIFPRNEDEPSECLEDEAAIDTTVIVGTDQLVVATVDGRLRVLEFDGEEIPLDNEIDLVASINSPLIGEDRSIFITASDGSVIRFAGVPVADDATPTATPLISPTAEAEPTPTPFESGRQLFLAGLFTGISAAPNLGPDGVTYAGGEGGELRAVCTNAVARFARQVGGIDTPAAITDDPTLEDDEVGALVLVASDSGRVEAYEDDRGDVRWSFFTSSRITRSSVVVDSERDQARFYIADTAGFVFAGRIVDGQPVRGADRPFQYRAARCIPGGTDLCTSNLDCPDALCLGERITAALALGTDHVYAASEGGRTENGDITTPAGIYAFPERFTDGVPTWAYQGPAGSSIRSSPAVVIDNSGSEVVIAGIDIDVCATDPPDPDCTCGETTCVPLLRGRVLALDTSGSVLWEHDLPDEIGTASPSVRSVDADTLAIYIGTQGGQLFEILW